MKNRGLIFVALAVSLSACEGSFEVIGDPTVPLELSMDGGVPTLGVRGNDTIGEAILDTGSPLSVVNRDLGCSAATTLALTPPASVATPVVRSIFPDLHPLCTDGGSVVGGDLLTHAEVLFARGLRAPSGLCSGLFDCVSLLGGEVQPTAALEGQGFALLSFHLLGGGKFIDEGGRTRSWGATRIPIRACLNPPAYRNGIGLDLDMDMHVDTVLKREDLGRDLTLLVATGIGPLVLGEQAYAAVATDPSGGISTTLAIPGSAPIEARDRPPFASLVLVGQTLYTSDLRDVRDPGPCGELLRVHCASFPQGSRPTYCTSAAGDADSCRTIPNEPQSMDCKPLNGDRMGSRYDVEPTVEFMGPISVVTMPDETPYLQAARKDVRPRLADADGFLGADLLRRVDEMRIDYLGVSSDEQDSGPRLMIRCDKANLGCPNVTVSPRARFTSPEDQ